MALASYNGIWFLKLKWWYQWIITSLLAFVLYIPIIGNSFVNDDFIVLKRVCIDGRLNIDGFFRPLSDISIFLTYQLAGLHPFAYYFTGILLHGLSTSLLIQLCIRWKWTVNEQSQQYFALLAGALFFTYPFHNESVAWILGRGALIANTFGIIALLILISPRKEVYKQVLIGGCYFAGLAAYESIIVLPAIILIWLVVNRAGIRSIGWIIMFGITLVLHLLLRMAVSGSLTGEYGEGFLNAGWNDYAVKAFKALGRVFLPPVNNPLWMIVPGLVVLIVIALVVIRLRRKLAGDELATRFFNIQTGCFLVAMLIPVVAGVSTRTSESDRFLHLPSYFIAILAAFAIIILLKGTKWFTIAITVILCFQVICLEINNLNWRKASTAVSGILDIARTTAGKQSLYIINLPEEINGAYIFRVGFKEALLINNIDTSIIYVGPLQKEGIVPGSKIVDWQQDKWIEIK